MEIVAIAVTIAVSIGLGLATARAALWAMFGLMGQRERALEIRR
jgi:hypothetical protein